MDEVTVRLITKLDASKTAADMKNIENQLNKKGIHLKTVLDTATTKNEIEQMAVGLQSVLSNIKGFENITVNRLVDSIRTAQAETQKLQNSFQELSLSAIDTNAVNIFDSLKTGKEEANGFINVIKLLGASISGALDAKNPGRSVPVYGI